MYEGIQSEVISTTRFHENSDLILTYLGKIYITRASKIKAEENSLYQVYCRKIIRWYGMSDTIGYRSIISVQVALVMVLNFTFLTKICT